MSAESVTVESDERGFELHFVVTEEPFVDERGHMVVNIQACDLDTFYDQVKARIGPYLREKEEAFAEFRAARYPGGGYVRFLCAVDDVDESGGYDRSDPKHPEYHSVHADIWDLREGK
jgi:hypothetical protein